MFHKEFYPTPYNVIGLMDFDCSNKVVLEPHAGKGDIVNYCLNNGAIDVYTYEINKDLQKIISPISNFLGDDFLKANSREISQVDMIIMNPPFSNAIEHIKHAWDIAPEGCEIISLCNYDTIDDYDNRINGFARILKDSGDYSNLGTCFDNAERKTNCNIGLVKLFKPISSSDFDFEHYFSQDFDKETSNGKDGIMPYNEIKAIVNSYTGAIKEYAKLEEVKKSVNSITSKFNFGTLEVNAGYRDATIRSISDFSVKLQLSAWKYVFKFMNMEKYTTKGVKDKINRFITQQTKYPFTMTNIYRVIDMVYQTRQTSFDESLIEAIEYYTKHTHENRFNVEGWKSNSSYMLNKKFIINDIVSEGFRNDGLSCSYGNIRAERLDDLVKVICNIRGVNYDRIKPINLFCDSHGGLDRGVWYQWCFFKIKVFKKGTMHLVFVSEDDWFAINQAYGKLKGFTVPENCNPSKNHKHKS